MFSDYWMSIVISVHACFKQALKYRLGQEFIHNFDYAAHYSLK